MDSRLNDHLLHSSGRAAYAFVEGLSKFSSGFPGPARLSTGFVLDWESASCCQEMNNASVNNRLRSLLTNMRPCFPNIFPFTLARLRVMVSKFVGAAISKTGELDECQLQTTSPISSIQRHRAGPRIPISRCCGRIL